MDNNKFIITMDKDTSDRLIKNGLYLVNYENGTWTFLNDNKYTFESEDKVSTTNKLCF